MATELTLSDFDFHLPPELIAQHPLPERAASRLLHVAGTTLTNRHFTELPQLLRAGDVLVFNNTRVIKARLFGRKPSGGKVELLVERVLDAQRALVLLRTSHKPKEGQRIELGASSSEHYATVLGRHDDFFDLQFNTDVLSLLEQQGSLPLPPYIAHAPQAQDEERYQTVYASAPGAVAAPTAGLHFTNHLLTQLDQMGVQRVQLTLHVGAGTFQPVRSEKLSEHRMHAEQFFIDPDAAAAINAAKAEGRRVVAVGTTSLRALEAAGASGHVQAGHAETRLFITPGYQFRVVDRLITNFHLPRSTLLMLVAAFAGRTAMQRAYAHAIEQRYRFFSYGDASLLERATHSEAQ